MQNLQEQTNLKTTAITLLVGGAGALVGFLLSFPVYILTGPAILISLLSLIGLRTAVPLPLRDAAFLLIGISIGTGVDATATAAFLRWPLAFLVLAAVLYLMMRVSRAVLMRGFGYDQSSAVLAATPGHLSFVLSMGAALNVDVAKIAVIQSVRLFSLTLIVPFAALIFGVEINGQIGNPMPAMVVTDLLVLIIAGVVFGLILKRFAVPAPLLIGGLIASTFTHITGQTPGVLHPVLALPAFALIGTLIGTRFSGVDFNLLKSCFLAGLAATIVAISFAFAASVPVAIYLDMPLPHVLVAFAPGGLETMIAMGAVLGANPGFVAAAHIARLLLLILFVPLLLPRKPNA